MKVLPKRKILFISYGDSRSAKSWSNVPFLFSKHLENRGFEIVRLNILPDPKHEQIWKKYVGRILSRFFKNQQYSFIRSYIFRHLTFTKIKKELRKNPDVYFCVSLNFEFYNKFNKTPTLLLGDWTYDIAIIDRLNRKPYFFEKWFINHQKEAISKSKIVISLFKDSQEKIQQRFNKNIHHLGINVVNDLNLFPLSKETILNYKQNSNDILFIGSLKYLDGLKKLILAFRSLQKNNSQLNLHIIGVERDKLPLSESDSQIYCYGYLRKDNSDENKIYYSLLSRTRVLINPAEIWAAYSSTIEAMKYYTPIIIKPYEAFEIDFGSKNNFGLYLTNTSVENIEKSIEYIFSLNIKEYESLCLNSHNLVKNYTWENYTDKVINLMSQVKECKI